MEAALYRSDSDAGTWDGGHLAAAIEGLEARRDDVGDTDGLPALYPGQA